MLYKLQRRSRQSKSRAKSLRRSIPEFQGIEPAINQYLGFACAHDELRSQMRRRSGRVDQFLLSDRATPEFGGKQQDELAQESPDITQNEAEMRQANFHKEQEKLYQEIIRDSFRGRVTKFHAQFQIVRARPLNAIG